MVRLPPAPRGARPVRAGQAHRRGAARAGSRRRRQARLEREPAGPVAEGDRGGPRRDGRGQPLPGPAGDGAAGSAERAPRDAGLTHRGGQRLRRDHRPDRPRVPRARRQRRHLRARLRPLPSGRGRPQPRGPARPDARLDARPRGDGGGDRRPDAPRLRREPQQPHRHLEPPDRGGGARRRAAPGVPARPRRGLLRVHRRPRLPERHRPRPPRGAGDRDPHLLEGVRARGAPRRLRGGRAGGAGGSPRDPRGLRHELGGPGGGDRRAGRRRARPPLGGDEPERRRRASPPRSATAASRSCRASPTSSPSTPAPRAATSSGASSRAGVIVRPLDPYAMRSWLRVSVGTPEENAAFLAALDVVLPGKRP